MTVQQSIRTAQAVPARIAPLASLPLFHRIAGRKVVVAGGGDGAVWKAELLSAAGANVLVLAGSAAAWLTRSVDSRVTPAARS